MSFAPQSRTTAFVKLLLAEGAATEVASKAGHTPLMVAVGMGRRGEPRPAHSFSCKPLLCIRGDPYTVERPAVTMT